MSNNNRKAIAIDGNSLLYRCFYATFKQLPYYAQHNIQPTNALNLFVYSILKLLTSNKYDYAIVAFDHGKRTFRTAKYDLYKDGRKPMPKELVVQLPEIKMSPELMGVLGMSLENYEADDLIGSFAKLMNKNNVSVEIYSSDRDMLQLVNELNEIKLIKTGVSVFDDINIDNFKTKFFELTPNQVVDYKGIAGDSSDHLKGIAGIGPKTAASLLKQYGSLEGIYDHINELPAKIQTKMNDYKQQAFDCKELATIYKDLFNENELDMFATKAPNFDKLFELTKKHNLNFLDSFIRNIQTLYKK